MNGYGDVLVGQRDDGRIAPVRRCHSGVISRLLADGLRRHGAGVGNPTADATNVAHRCENQSNGSGYSSNGIRYSSNGTGYWSNGRRYSSNGSDYWSNGRRYSSNGTSYSSSGSSYSSNGTGYSSNGSAYSSNGSGYCSNGSSYSSNATRYSSNATAWSSNASVRSARRNCAQPSLTSMQARSHAPGAGSHAGSPPPGMRSTVFR